MRRECAGIVRCLLRIRFYWREASSYRTVPKSGSRVPKAGIVRRGPDLSTTLLLSFSQTTNGIATDLLLSTETWVAEVACNVDCQIVSNKLTSFLSKEM
jgi:hypothetical protein